MKTLLSGFEGHRKTWNGLRIYAIDGQQITLPRSKDIVKAGYNGRSVSKFRESYMPKGYLNHAYDVLSGVTKALRFSCRLHEQNDSRSMVQTFEKNSLTLYDRAYFSKKQAKVHFTAKNFFLIRCKKNSSKEIWNLSQNKKRRARMVLDGQTIHLIKITNRKNNEEDIFATNLQEKHVTVPKIKELYRLRWAVETSFAELTATLHLEQWHSKSENGIKQEIYTLFWIINYTKILLFSEGPQKRQKPLSKTYKKPNFKLIFNFIAKRMPKIMLNLQRFITRIRELIRVSTEKRKARSRSFPREIRSPASPYPYNNTRWWFES